MVRVGEDIQQRAKVGVFVIGLEAYWEPFFCHVATYAASSEGPTHHCDKSA
jgi:hypothetical protein